MSRSQFGQNHPANRNLVPGKSLSNQGIGHGLSTIFRGKNGIRSGWILLLFLVIYAALTFAAQYAFNSIPTLKNWAAAQAHGGMTPISSIAFIGLEAVFLFLSVGLVSRMDRRSFRDYALPLQKNIGWRLLQGAITGAVMASALIVLIALCGGYTFGGLAIHGATIAKNGLLYVLGFFLVGLVEEFSFRGFMQSVLQRALGFWPAAVALSLLFGAIHLPNSGESWKGVLLIVPFGLLASLALRRTGSLWFFIGVHAAFDCCIAFIYSSPMTGLTAQGHLLNASFHGPSWLTGGTVGPTGSVFAFVVVILASWALLILFPKRAGIPSPK